MRSMLRTIFLLLSLAFVLCSAGDYERREQTISNVAKILQYEFDNIGTGPYRFSFATSDGTERREEGNLINPNTDDEALVVTGSYSYVGPDGVTYTVKYTADQNGFHPEGDHIKVPPFVPWTKHQHDADHSGHYHHHQTATIKSTAPIYVPVTQRPILSTPSPVYGNSNLQKPLIAQFIASNPRPALSQVISSTTKPQTFIPFREQPALLTYLPTRREVDSNEEHATFESSNVANSIIEILNADGKDNNEKKIKIEDINAL